MNTAAGTGQRIKEVLDDTKTVINAILARHPFERNDARILGVVISALEEIARASFTQAQRAQVDELVQIVIQQIPPAQQVAHEGDLVLFRRNNALGLVLAINEETIAVQLVGGMSSQSYERRKDEDMRCYNTQAYPYTIILRKDEFRHD